DSPNSAATVAICSLRAVTAWTTVPQMSRARSARDGGLRRGDTRAPLRDAAGLRSAATLESTATCIHLTSRTWLDNRPRAGGEYLMTSSFDVVKRWCGRIALRQAGGRRGAALIKSREFFFTTALLGALGGLVVSLAEPRAGSAMPVVASP